MELLISLLTGALGGNLARGISRGGRGFLLGSALGALGGGLAALALARSGVGGLSHAPAVNGTGIDPTALVVQAAVCAAGGAMAVALSGLATRRAGE